MDNRYRKRRINSVISSWMSFIFVLFFFYVIGYLVMRWWYFEWWVWLILGISFISALGSTLRFIAYRSSNIPAQPEVRYYTHQNISTYTPENESLYNQPITSTIPKEAYITKYCAYCGSNLEPGSKYCTNCGAPVQ